MATKTNKQTKREYNAHNSQGAFLASYIAVSAKAAARRCRKQWQVTTGDKITVSAVDGTDSVTVRAR